MPRLLLYLTRNMDVSVIICTYNRCESLRKTLQTFCDLEIPKDATWELLVVDNNSDDTTRQVCESFAGRLPLLYLFEPRQGQSCARNRGIKETTAPILLFSDDDVNVDKKWLAVLWKAAELHADVSIFGGKILPVWEETPPAWLEENSKAMLRLVCTYLDLGDEERAFNESCAGPWGANMAFRRSVFTDRFPFREELGLNGRDNARGEETDMIQRLFKRGCKGLYVPQAIVYHRNPPERATERYVVAYYKGAGMTDIRHRGVPPGGRLWFGLSRYFWLKVVKHAVQYTIFRWTRPPEIWLRAEIDMAKNWGRIRELRRLREQM